MEDEVIYRLTWRNKWLTSTANDIEDMISLLRDAADELEQMKNDGVTLDAKSDAADDYADLITTDEVIAKKYQMEVMEDDF